jgi:glycosyltransferase involved in cell wall biosynthesis
VSVVIRAHNAAPWIDESIDSVVSQSMQPFQVVIVDDGSTDATRAIAERRAADLSNFRFIHRSPNRGAAATFNDGVQATSGSLIVVLDADDRLSPNYLEKVSDAIAQGGADFAYTETRLFGVDDGVWPARPFETAWLARENFVNVSAMFRREVFESTGGQRTDMQAFEDWEFWVHAADLGFRGAAVSDCWLDYRRHQHASRSTISRITSYRLHWRLHRLHPRVVRARDVVTPFVRHMANRARRNPSGRVS